ncbi:hypothetical protein D3C80_562090 [compost metagenome]
MFYACCSIGGEVQAASRVVFLHQGFEARFVDRDMSLLKAFDLVGIDINTDYVVTDLCEYGALNQADVTNAKNCDFHVDSH